MKDRTITRDKAIKVCFAEVAIFIRSLQSSIGCRLDDARIQLVVARAKRELIDGSR